MIHVPHPATREQLVAAIDQAQDKARANVVDAEALADEALAIWRRAEVAAAALELPPGRLHARASVDEAERRLGYELGRLAHP